MSDADPKKLAHELEEEAVRLQKQSEKLHDEIDEVREDWERKRADPSVPGAPPPSEAEREAGEVDGGEKAGDDHE